MSRFDQDRGRGPLNKGTHRRPRILRSMRIKEDLKPLGSDHGPLQGRPPRADPERGFPAFSVRAGGLRRDRGFGLSGRAFESCAGIRSLPTAEPASGRPMVGDVNAYAGSHG